jgi:prevent-host-death family protein
MKFLNIRDLRLKTPSVLKSVENGEKIVITNHGKPQAILLHLTEDEIEDLVYQQPEFMTQIEESRKEYKVKGGVSLAEARKRLGL